MERAVDTGKILAYALKLEQDGRRFYLAMAKKSKNPLGKKTLKAIADDEIRHIREIRRTAEDFKWVLNKPAKTGAAGKRWQTIFSEAIRDKRLTKANLTDLKAFKVAMKLETKGYDYYKKSAKKIADLKGKKFFEFLAAEENGHYGIFERTYNYLKDPENWFKGEEKPIYEGG